MINCDLQKIVFPTSSKHYQCRALFFRGDSGTISREESVLHIGLGQTYDFVTYINGFSYRKWKRYTQVKEITLDLCIKGKCIIKYVGYHLECNRPVRVDFDEKCTDVDSFNEIVTYTFPDNDEMIIGFEISGLGNCVLKDGWYRTEVQDNLINDCELAIATTTCRKEKYIIPNVKLIQQELMSEDSGEISQHIFLHIVDNGRSLNYADVCGEKTYLHPNPNLGGSGGYARGMHEALHQKPKATNVLLMDDDVMVLPESIRRTYNFLKIQKPEYKEYFIAGAMLLLEEPNRQWEDIGTVLDDFGYRPLKRSFDQNCLIDNLLNEKDYSKKKREYSAWWYCCIPSKTIERYGYPLPLFLRCDDSEYSIRCNARLITMNGICIWHMGFKSKWNNASDLYLHHRNMAIVNAVNPGCWYRDIWKILWEQYYFELTRFNYSGADIMLKAIEDFLKGPEFLCGTDPEQIYCNNMSYNEKLVNINTIPEATKLYDAQIVSAEIDDQRKFISKVLYHLTDNGHRGLGLKRKGLAVIPANNVRVTEKVTLHIEALAVNIQADTATYRKIDRNRYREIQKKARRIKRLYKKSSKEINKQYLDHKNMMTSEEFWVSRWKEN